MSLVARRICHYLTSALGSSRLSPAILAQRRRFAGVRKVNGLFQVEQYEARHSSAGYCGICTGDIEWALSIVRPIVWLGAATRLAAVPFAGHSFPAGLTGVAVAAAHCRLRAADVGILTLFSGCDRASTADRSRGGLAGLIAMIPSERTIVARAVTDDENGGLTSTGEDAKPVMRRLALHRHGISAVIVN